MGASVARMRKEARMNNVFLGRECRGKHHVNGSYQEFEKGMFLGFGEGFKKLEGGLAQYTTAIVELEDGQVIVTAPQNIQFVNKRTILEKPLAGSAGALEPPDDEIPSEDKKDAGRDNEEAKEANKAKRRGWVDHRKIRALKNAGWSNKEIADEMHMTPNSVAQSLSTHKELIEELKRI